MYYLNAFCPTSFDCRGGGFGLVRYEPLLQVVPSVALLYRGDFVLQQGRGDQWVIAKDCSCSAKGDILLDDDNGDLLTPGIFTKSGPCSRLYEGHHGVLTAGLLLWE